MPNISDRANVNLSYNSVDTSSPTLYDCKFLAYETIRQTLGLIIA